MKTEWTTKDIPSQAGRRVLITGANSGIGWEAALELARRGAEIILPARTEAKADDAIARIRAQVPNAKLIPEILDLADLNPSMPLRNGSPRCSRARASIC